MTYLSLNNLSQIPEIQSCPHKRLKHSESVCLTIDWKQLIFISKETFSLFYYYNIGWTCLREVSCGTILHIELKSWDNKCEFKVRKAFNLRKREITKF